MKIIDKNTDFYDYYQNIYKDDFLTFDRRDSFLLTKDLMASFLDGTYNWGYMQKKYHHKKYNYALLQICHEFWLFAIEIKEIDNFHRVTDYSIELLTHWKNTNKPRKLCNLEIIDFYYYYRSKPHDKIPALIKEIDTNNYKIKKTINKHIIYNGNKKIEKHIPLLKACGIANCIDAHQVYLAFEEFFSLEKSSLEKTEPLGATDIDKVESHGFDKVISFRGK